MFNELLELYPFPAYTGCASSSPACPRIWDVYFPCFLFIMEYSNTCKRREYKEPLSTVPVVSKWSVLLHIWTPSNSPHTTFYFWFVSFSILYFLSWFSNNISYKNFKLHKCTKQRMWQPSVIPHSSDNNHCSQFGVRSDFCLFAVNILYDINNHILSALQIVFSIQQYIFDRFHIRSCRSTLFFLTIRLYYIICFAVICLTSPYGWTVERAVSIFPLLQKGYSEHAFTYFFLHLCKYVYRKESQKLSCSSLNRCCKIWKVYKSTYFVIFLHIINLSCLCQTDKFKLFHYDINLSDSKLSLFLLLTKYQNSREEVETACYWQRNKVGEPEPGEWANSHNGRCVELQVNVAGPYDKL